MSTPELKPCPFCGGKVEFLQDHAGDGCFISHIARDCGVELSSLQPNDMGLIAIWNTRHSPAESALNAAREALKKSALAMGLTPATTPPSPGFLAELQKTYIAPAMRQVHEALAQINKALSPQQSKTT